MPHQNVGNHLTLVGPREADNDRHITTGPPIFLDDAAPLEYQNPNSAGLRVNNLFFLLHQLSFTYLLHT